METFYALCSMAMVAIIALLVSAIVIFHDHLKSIKKTLYMILDNVRPIDNSITNTWSTILRIRDDTAKMTGFLDKDKEESEEDADISEDGWVTGPCPVCGGPAYMDYSLPSGDGYCVMCGRNANAHGHCDFGTVAGGPTRKIAALMWNKSVMVYCNNKNMRAMNDAEET